MSALSDFFLGSRRSTVQLELLEISHPAFSKTYYICRNYRDGVTVTLETSVVQFFEFLPLKITSQGARDDLDTGISVSLGDLGEIIPQEIDRIEAVDGFSTPPKAIFRIYRSDILSAPMIGPYEFEIKAISHNDKGATFQAKAPGLNYGRTGLLYKLDVFPMLRGFL